MSQNTTGPAVMGEQGQTGAAGPKLAPKQQRGDFAEPGGYEGYEQPARGSPRFAFNTLVSGVMTSWAYFAGAASL